MSFATFHVTTQGMPLAPTPVATPGLLARLAMLAMDAMQASHKASRSCTPAGDFARHGRRWGNVLFQGFCASIIELRLFHVQALWHCRWSRGGARRLTPSCSCRGLPLAGTCARWKGRLRAFGQQRPCSGASNLRCERTSCSWPRGSTSACEAAAPQTQAAAAGAGSTAVAGGQ